jgi:cytochrome c oxidase subunit 1/cytochrome c oxidase subunit I+III
MYSESLGRWAFWLVFVGMHVTFFPMHIAGLLGMPRRVYTYPAGLDWQPWSLVATVGAYILAVGLLLVLAGVVHAMRRGRPAGDDPWGGDTLEWATTSPPEPYNFPVIPRVHSLHPVWDERTAESTGPGATEDRILAKGRQTVLTSELDGSYERPVDMPEVTLRPFVAAAGLLVMFVGLLFSWYWVAAAGGLTFAATLAVWLWPKLPPQDAGAAT